MFKYKLYRKLSQVFLSPRREYNLQPVLHDLQWDVLTIELLGLRWQREGYDEYIGSYIQKYLLFLEKRLGSG